MNKKLKYKTKQINNINLFNYSQIELIVSLGKKSYIN